MSLGTLWICWIPRKGRPPLANGTYCATGLPLLPYLPSCRSAGNGIGSCSAKRCFGRTIATISGVRGYGDFAIANDTGGDIVFTANFKSARRLIEHWKAFKHARQRIIDRCHATRIAEV